MGMTTKQILQGVHDWTNEKVQEVVNGEKIPALAENLAPWADQKAIATPDTYTDAVRTTGGDIPIETSAGSKLESIKPVAGSKWTAKLLFNGSYNMLNAAKWGATNSQPYVGGVGSDFVYFLVPELTLGTFGTADENNGLLFTDEDGVNVQPTSVYFKPLGATVPQSLTDGTSITPTNVSYDGKTYKDYATSGAGWLVIPKSYYDNDVCAHIAWEDWYDKHVSLDEPTTNPEAVVGILMLEGLLALAHSDKYLRGVNEEVCDNVVFGETSATISHMVDEVSVAANAWTNAATGESDSQGNALYRHSATVSGIKNGGAACVEGENGGIPLTVNGTTVSYVDTNATAPASVVFYQIPTTAVVEKAYTDNVFSGSNIDVETGVLPINDCSIEAQVAMDGNANITVKYAKNIVDQVAINATVDVPQIKEQVEEHEERITNLEDTAVRTGSYDASVAVGLADNFKGDTIVEAEFYYRKTGGTQSVGSGIAAIKEVRGKSIVWNQLKNPNLKEGETKNGVTYINNHDGTYSVTGTAVGRNSYYEIYTDGIYNHKYLIKGAPKDSTFDTYHIRVAYDSGELGKDIGEGIIVQPQGIFVVFLRVVQNVSVNAIFTPQIFDLTLMFGEGKEPATVEEFEKMFPLDYYDYNAGTIIPFAGQNLVTTGFNQWDEQWELGTYVNGQKTNNGSTIRCKNPIKVFPSTVYNFKTVKTYIHFLDVDGGFISSIVHYGGVFTTPSNAAFIVFRMDSAYGTTYNNDICINISNEDRNGTYEPYEKHTLPLDPSQWRDKNGDLVFPYGGMHGVGTAYDYAKVDADGYIRKAMRCFGYVDIGETFTFTKNGVRTYMALVSDRKIESYMPDNYTPANILCTQYITINQSNWGRANKYISLNSTKDGIIITDDTYADVDVSDFKTAMQGVMLIYQLRTPVEVELATPVYAKYLVDKDGIEEITPANGATPYTTMANISVLYAMDARGEIKNLPKNYLSKESAENMLNAMVSAGVIASYTMTYDATSGRYVFTFVKAQDETPTNAVNNEESI